MITKEEHDKIVNEVVEQTLLKIPEIVGNLITSYATKIRVSKEFYQKYPEFKDQRDIVASVIESLDNASSFKPFKEVVESAVPEIRRRIKSIKGLNVTDVKKPNLDFGQGEL